MRVIALAAITADGFIAHDHLELPTWTTDKRLFKQISLEAGIVIMGRKTYDTLPRPLLNRKVIVITRQQDLLSHSSDKVVYTQASPAEIVSQLEREGYKEIVVAGGASIYRIFFTSGMLDEIWLTIEPLLFGSGVKLLDETISTTNLKLVSVTTLSTNTIHTRYKLV